MTKKLTSWVTIPEEKNNTHSTKKSDSNSDTTPVKNKIFWGAAFVVMILVVTALLAPRQAASVLQGNLFAQSGIEGAEDVASEGIGIKPLNLIPVEQEEVASDTVSLSEGESESSEVSSSEDSDSESESEFSSEDSIITLPETENVTVVSAETDAVTIEVEPVEIEIEPIVTEPENQSESISEELTEPLKEAVKEEVVSTPESETKEVSVSPEIKEELDINRQLLEQLSRQIAEFQEKDKQNNQALQDLTEIVKDEIVRPAADTNTPAEITTVLLGQNQESEVSTPIVSPTGYRVNVHTVKITPQQALQQNTTRVEMQQSSAPSTELSASSDTFYSNYDAQLSQAEGTPESGPKESMMMAFILTFVALLGWKFLKMARS